MLPVYFFSEVTLPTYRFVLYLPVKISAFTNVNMFTDMILSLFLSTRDYILGW